MQIDWLLFTSRLHPQKHVTMTLVGLSYLSLIFLGGNCQSIESTVSDAIVRSWQWSTATGSTQLGYFSCITVSS